MAGEKGTLEDLEKQAGNLTPDQEEALQAEALKEMEEEGLSPEEKAAKKKKDEEEEEGEEEGTKEGEEEGKSDQELLEAKDEDLDDTEKAKKQELLTIKKEEEETRLLEAKEEDLSEEEKTQKATILKAREDTAKETLAQEIKDYAAENKISAEEARQDIESISKINEKYSNDPKKLSKANLHLQRMVTETQKENKTLKETPVTPPPQMTVAGWIEAINEGKVKVEGKPTTKEQLLQAYREQHPKITEDEDDDTIVKMVAKDIIAALEAQEQTQTVNVSKEAGKKRDTLIEELSDENKRYAKEIKDILAQTSDTHLMSDSHNLDDVIKYVKGGHYDEDLKAHGEKEFRRGLEQAKILGEKKPPQGDGKPKKKGKAKVSEVERQRALEMFDGQEMTEEQKIEAYLEVKAHEAELDKNK